MLNVTAQTSLSSTLSFNPALHGLTSHTKNTTGLEQSTGQMMLAPERTEMAIMKSAVLGSIFLLSFIGNVATLAQLYRTRRRKSTVNLLIFHLATADLLVTFFCDVTEAAWALTVQWYAGNAACKFIKFAQVFSLYLSTYVIVIISVDRCSAVVDPLMTRNKAPRRVRILLATAWGVSLLFSLPQAFIFSVQKGPFEEEFYQCVTYGAYTEGWQEPLYGVASLLSMYVLPLCAIITSYSLILITITKKTNELQEETDTGVSLTGFSGGSCTTSSVGRGRLLRRAKSRSLCMTALIVIAFIICWTPYEVILLLHLLSNVQVDSQHTEWIFFFGMTNSLFNPIIYGACQLCKRPKSHNHNGYRTESRVEILEMARRSRQQDLITGVPGGLYTDNSYEGGTRGPRHRADVHLPDWKGSRHQPLYCHEPSTVVVTLSQKNSPVTELYKN